MWTRGTEETTRVFGVLNDWDLATPVNAIGSSTNHRTGTGPFMALDLLGKEPPVHLYRHDLESLFYVLIWAAVHYDIGGTVPYTHIVEPVLQKWTGNYEDAHVAKSTFLGRPKSVLEAIKPVWGPLRTRWLKPLCDLFQKAHHNANLLDSAAVPATSQAGEGEAAILTGSQGSALVNPNNSNDENDDENNAKDLTPAEPGVPITPVHIDFETLGCLTFEKFMAALDNWKPRRIPKKYREHANRLLAEE